VAAVVAAGGVATAAEPVTFKNRRGTHTLKVGDDGTVYHALNDSLLGSVNDETARATAGNRLWNVVAVAGTGFADLDDVHVMAVDRDGKVWHTARLPDGTWLRWGSVTDEIGYTGKAVGVACSSRGRKLLVRVVDAAGVEKRTVREPDGTWTR
jgi:hypothetical protein